jgi:uncharacterized repeat protein (TIGR03803 family)
MRLGCCCTLITAASLSAWCQSEAVIHNFATLPSDGAYPSGGVILDASGNLFGTTSSGTTTSCAGTSGCGIVFEFAESSNGYSETTLYAFGTNSPNSDGGFPQAGLIEDASGNLFGTTAYGGSIFLPQCATEFAFGCGTAFELVKTANSYSENVLYAFTGPDGANPFGPLVQDSGGNLFGTTLSGGAASHGTVFELVNSSGNYTFKSLYSFGTSASDGWYPLAGLLLDASGNLYGTTSGGGDLTQCGGGGCGTVFEMVNSPNGYTHDVLYGFQGNDALVGQGPAAGLIMDGSGNLYGTTQGGGSFDHGTVFELLNSSGNYSEKILYSFEGFSNNDGQIPAATLLMDSSGNLYGTASQGGVGCVPQGCGTVFELINSTGTYVEKSLHNFGAPGDGETPTGALVEDSSGNLYGTTLVGGAVQFGTVFQVNPDAAAPAVTLSASSLIFGSQLLNTTSAAQSITVTNSGKVPLIFGAGAVTISGNAVAFATNSDACSNATIPVNATCSASVTFTPLVGGTSNAILTFADNAPNALQTVSIAGTGVVPIPAVTLTPSSLTFPTQDAGTTSSAQPVTLTNSGPGPLNITSISATANFSETNNCGSSVPVGAACTLYVSIDPTASGTVDGTVFVSDNGYGSPQSVALSGTGADFSIGPASGSSSSVAVSPGESATYSLSLTPLDGYNLAVTVACSGAPALAVCSASPAVATLDGTNTVPVTLTVTTTAPMAILRHHSHSPGAALAAILLVLPFTFWLSPLRGTNHSIKLALSSILVLTLAFSVSCGGGDSGTQPSSPSTPAGAYTLTVNASSGTLTHLTFLSLTVK